MKRAVWLAWSGGLVGLAALLLLSSSLLPGRMLRALASNAQVAVSPSSSTLLTGASETVTITVANVTNLGGYDLSLAFSPSVVHLNSLADAGLFRGGKNIVVCSTPVIDNNAGTASASCATVPFFGTPFPGVDVTTPAALVTGSFTALSAGVSAVDLTGTTLDNPSGTPVSSSLTNGSITVQTPVPVGGFADAAPTPAAGAEARGRRWEVAAAGGALVIAAALAAVATRRRGRPSGR